MGKLAQNELTKQSQCELGWIFNRSKRSPSFCAEVAPA